ncbi:MAG: recombinase family protein [Bacilli bacterium]|nr:recombinase family protein [Bacilli bacterium]
MNSLVVEKSRLDDTVEVYRRREEDVSDVSSKYFKPKRVAAYCRVSRNIEIQETSLDTQIDSYQRIISERPDWELVNVYYDKGITGTCASKRPGFMKMIDDCKAGKIDMIIAKSISRFARNTVDTLEYTRMLKDLGIGVYFEKERIDTGDITSEMLLTVYAAFAQEESHSISENIRRGFRQRFQMGIPKFTKVYGYGVDEEDKNKWYIIPEEAKIVKEIFNLYLSGWSVNEISAKLTAENVPSPWKCAWYKTSITCILKNEKYVGDVVMQKTIVTDVLNHISVKNDDNLVPKYFKRDHHEAIIDRDDYDTVMRMFALKETIEGSGQYPYYDYLRCPVCGGQMIQFMGKLARNPRTWICLNAHHCNHKFILSKYIDRAVIEAIKELPYGLTGYEDAIRKAKEHFEKGGAVELYYLKKLIDKIEIVDDYTAIKITFPFGKETIYKINFDTPSENGNPKVEYRGNNLYINNKFYTPKVGIRVAEAINNNQIYNESLEFLPPTKTDGIYRIRNVANAGRKSWGKMKDEDNCNQTAV